jgi:hypothetical protein
MTVLQLALVLALAADKPAAPPGSQAVGQLRFRSGNKTLNVGQVQELFANERLGLEFRRGAEIVPAELRRDGVFVLRAPAGKYRLEYVRLGARAEFIAPREIEVPASGSACVGTFELALADVEVELGTNSGNTFSVADTCTDAKLAALLPRGSAFLAPVDVPVLSTPSRRTWIEWIVALRAGGFGTSSPTGPLGTSASDFYLQYHVAFPGTLDDGGHNLRLVAHYGVFNRRAGLGLGYSGFGLIELTVGGLSELEQSSQPASTGLWGQARLGFIGYGFGARVEKLLVDGTRGEPALGFFFDLSPGYLIGGWL